MKKQEFLKTERDIRDWLDKFYIKKYVLIPDERYGFVVDINENVYLFKRNLDWIPVKFNKVSGDFNCSHNNLTSLEFCPRVVNGYFDCSNNRLTSLEFCPETIGGGFDCSFNQLTLLEFAPRKINWDFHCDNNELISLKFCPEEVSGNFLFNNNKVDNLLYFPSYIKGRVAAHENNLNDFNTKNEFYEEHKKQTIEALKNKVESKLGKELGEGIIKSGKIKL